MWIFFGEMESLHWIMKTNLFFIKYTVYCDNLWSNQWVGEKRETAHGAAHRRTTQHTPTASSIISLQEMMSDCLREPCFVFRGSKVTQETSTSNKHTGHNTHPHWSDAESGKQEMNRKLKDWVVVSHFVFPFFFLAGGISVFVALFLNPYPLAQILIHLVLYSEAFTPLTLTTTIA